MAQKPNWAEIDDVIATRKRDLKLSGKEINRRMEEEGLNGELPINVWGLKLITKLEISHLPSLKNIPSYITNMDELKDLIITDNVNLTSIPSDFGKINELKTLILENNSLTSLPKEIGNLKKLQVINAAGNKLTELPKEIFHMQELLTLNLARNKFVEFPKLMNKLSKLSNLSLANNEIVKIDIDFTPLVQLSIVDISNNQIKDVPYTIGNANKLKEIKMDGNPYSDKKFIKLVENDKAKVVQTLKKNAPKPKKESNKQVFANLHRIRYLSSGSKAKDIQHEVLVSSKQTFRPHLLMVVLKNIEFNDKSFKEFIDLQTEIHQTTCKKRTVAAIGTHDLDNIVGPFSYQAVNPKDIQFVPLKQEEEVSGEELLEIFEKSDPTMSKYISLIKSEKLWPVLYDASNQVLSLPPVINSKYSQISIDTADILVEVSSSVSLEVCKEVMNEFLKKTSTLIIENSSTDALFVEQVKVLSENGHLKIRYPLESDIEEICKDE